MIVPAQNSFPSVPSWIGFVAQPHWKARNERGRSGWLVNGFRVSKETVLLRRWERSKQNFFLVLSYRKLTFRALALRQSEGLTLETSASPSNVRWFCYGRAHLLIDNYSQIIALSTFFFHRFSKTNICTLVLFVKEIKLYFLSQQKTQQIKPNVPKSDIGTVDTTLSEWVKSYNPIICGIQSFHYNPIICGLQSSHYNPIIYGLQSFHYNPTICGLQ